MMNVKAHGNEENDDIDRISSLPDEICTHIVSFLTTKEAVQTCILSKRWINTWASVPDLKFDIEEFGVPSIGVPWAKDSADKMAVEFVTKFELLLRNVLEKRETSCVNRFQLWLDSDIYLPWTRALVDCIADVMKLRPRECFIEMGLCKNLNLNTDVIFTCASLIHLQLYFYIKFDDFVAIEPNSVNLPCLKTLNLVGVTMSNDSFKKHLLGCPSLEELVLEDCNISIIEICSNTLKKLAILSCHDVKKLQISTPNLLYLDIEVKPKGKTLVLNMPSLVDASIRIRGWFVQDNYITRESELILSLSHVNSLRLDNVWYKLPKDCPVFNNLKHLELVNMTLDDFDRASIFLHHSPKLQELTISEIRAQKSKFLELTNEGPRDALVLPEFLQREFLKTVIISGDYRVVDQLINKLLAHVKMIGEIRTSTRTLSMVTWGRLHS